MAHIVKQNRPIEKKLIPKAEALELFAKKGQTLKCQLISEKAGRHRAVLHDGRLHRLLPGPAPADHEGDQGLQAEASPPQSYWKGKEGNPAMQRIYGYAFFTKEELDAHLQNLEEAKRRDHRKLGTRARPLLDRGRDGRRPHPLAPQGRLHPEADRGLLARRAPARAATTSSTRPHIAKLELWKTSGHTEYYKANMYSPIDIEDVEYQLKPMNCPFHITIYSRSCAATASCRSATRSWAPSTASSARACCTASCACAASPRTTRTSSAGPTSSRPRSCASSTS